MFSSTLLLQIGLVVAFIWIVILTIILFKEMKFMRQLFPKSDARDIRNKFKELIEIVNSLTAKEEELVKNFDNLRLEIETHIQKVAITRYNPYGDTGGDQSFSVALLNKQQTGFVLTSLHTRSGTRVYAKPVVSGKSQTELSGEEQDVLKKACAN